MKQINSDVEKFDSQYEPLPKEEWKYIEEIAYKALYGLISDLKLGDYLVPDNPFVKRNGDIIPSKRKRSGKSVEHMKKLRSDVLQMVKNKEITLDQASLITKKFGFHINKLKTFPPNARKNYIVSESTIDDLKSQIPKRLIKEYEKGN